MADYDWDLGPRKNYCETCKAYVKHFNHRPWCQEKILEHEWWRAILENRFTYIELNPLLTDMMYECNLCKALVRDFEKHYIYHYPKIFGDD